MSTPKPQCEHKWVYGPIDHDGHHRICTECGKHVAGAIALCPSDTTLFHKTLERFHPPEQELEQPEVEEETGNGQDEAKKLLKTPIPGIGEE